MSDRRRDPEPIEPRAGTWLDRLDEHDELPWRMHPLLVEGDDGLSRWPADTWQPLGLGLEMTVAR